MLGHRHRPRSPGPIKEEKRHRLKRPKGLAGKIILFIVGQKQIPLIPRLQQERRRHDRAHGAEHGIRGRSGSRRESRRRHTRESVHLRSSQSGRDGASVATVKITPEGSHHRLRGRADTELTESDAGLDTHQIFPDHLGEDTSDGSEGNSSDEEAGLAYEEWQEKSQQASTDIESEDSDEFDDNEDEDNSDSDSDDASSLDSDLDSELAPGLVADHGSDHHPDVDSDPESDYASSVASQEDPTAELDFIKATLGTETTSPDVSTSNPPLIPEDFGFTPHQDFDSRDIVYIPYGQCKNCPKGWFKLKWHRKRDKRHRGEGHYLVIYETKEHDGRVYVNGFTCTSLRQQGDLLPDVVRDEYIRLHGGNGNFRPTAEDEEGNLSAEPAELYLEDGGRMKFETYVETKPKSFWMTELKDFKFEHEKALVRHRLTQESLEHLLQRTIRSRNSYCGRPRSRDR